MIEQGLLIKRGCYITDIKTREPKNSLNGIYVWKDMWNNNNFQRWMINFLYRFYRFTRVSKLRYIPFWSAYFLCFFSPFMRPSFHRFICQEWLKNFMSVEKFPFFNYIFLKVGWQIAQLMFNLQSTQLFENFMSI